MLGDENDRIKLCLAGDANILVIGSFLYGVSVYRFNVDSEEWEPVSTWDDNSEMILGYYRRWSQDGRTIAVGRETSKEHVGPLHSWARENFFLPLSHVYRSLSSAGFVPTHVTKSIQERDSLLRRRNMK